jgi:type II secretory pathway pseudopilin PulG
MVELIAVIIITAILAAVAVPTLSGVPDTRCAAAAKQLVRDLSFARQRAASAGIPAWVVFDTGGETWSILVESHTTPGRDNRAALTDPATGRDLVQTMDADPFIGVELLTAAFDGAAEVGFDWRGRPLNSAEAALAADGSVTLTGGHTVTVDSGAGVISHTGP